MREDHRLGEWVEGFHTGSDTVTRFLALQACRDCGAVCVRDRSIDSLTNYDPDRRGPVRVSPIRERRKDHILGWYTGARPKSRIYT